MALRNASTICAISSDPYPCTLRYCAQDEPIVATSSLVMVEVIPAGFVIVPTTPALFCMYLYTVGIGAGVVEPLAGYRFAGVTGLWRIDAHWGQRGCYPAGKLRVF